MSHLRHANAGKKGMANKSNLLGLSVDESQQATRRIGIAGVTVAAADDAPSSKRHKSSSSSSASSSGTTTSDVVAAGMAAGNINIASGTDAHMELSASARAAIDDNKAMLASLDARRAARTVTVPTSDPAVRRRLRQVRHPITLFGERAPERRERLRDVLAKLTAEQSPLLVDLDKEDGTSDAADEGDVGIVVEAYTTQGSAELVAVRQRVLADSLVRARDRLAAQLARRRRDDATVAAVGDAAASAASERQYQRSLARTQTMHNAASVVGDERALSGCSFSTCATLLSTSSWTGACRVWSVPHGQHVATLRSNGISDDRVTDVRFRPGWVPASSASGGGTGVAAVASCDVVRHIKLWPLPSTALSASSSASESEPPVITPVATLTGHTQRCSRVCWHPSGTLLASTSFDTTWRLWDTHTQQCVLAQTGHARPTYAAAWHGDGALVAVGDLSGIVRVWDVRSGRSVLTLSGHVQQVLSTDFHRNGHTLASGSGDNMIRVWDLRQRACVYTVPAHRNVVTTVCYAGGGDGDGGAAGGGAGGDSEMLVSASFDGSVKVWSAVDYSLMTTLSGHGDRVSCARVSPCASYVASTSHDRTWKLWRREEEEQEEGDMDVDMAA